MMKKLIYLALILLSSTVLAEDIFTGWRLVNGEYKGVYKKYVFAFNKTPIPAKTEFAIYDAKSQKIMCCIIIGGKIYSQDEIENTYHIPNVWVSDIVSEIYAEPQVDNRPAYLAEFTKNLNIKAIEEYYLKNESPGGLIVPSNTKIGRKSGEIVIGKNRYLVKYKTDSFGDEQDGGYDLFKIYKIQNGKAESPPKIVQINYTTY